MDYGGIASLAIFTVTLYLMIKRPFGISLGLAAGVGAAFSLLFGTVSFNDAIAAFVDIWDAALAFIGIVAFSVTLDAIGFFRWAAIKVIKMAGGSGLKLYFYISMLTACVSILFANDSAILILTPIVLEIISQLKMDSNQRLAYLFSAGLIADTAAMPLITSNPVNIVSADYFKYTFIDHAVFMGPVAIATIISSLLIVYSFFRKKILRFYSMDSIEFLNSGEQIITPSLLKISFATLIAINVGYIIVSFNRMPVSTVICSGALFLLSIYTLNLKSTVDANISKRKSLSSLIREINWDIILFMTSIFLVVQGLRRSGAVDFFAQLFLKALKLPCFFSVFSLSMIVTAGASVMNNWPMTILGLLSIEQAANAGLSPRDFTCLVFSNIIGNNLGPHFFPLGSLAIIMWLETMRRKGVTIKLKDYLRVGSVVSVLEVAVASLILWLEITFLDMSLSIQPELFGH
jgi:arsenical pump membrane protein